MAIPVNFCFLLLPLFFPFLLFLSSFLISPFFTSPFFIYSFSSAPRRSRAPHPALLAIAGAVCKAHPTPSQQLPAPAAAPAAAPARAGGGAGCEIMVHRIPGNMTEEQVGIRL
jgi:hypothetical protein